MVTVTVPLIVPVIHITPHCAYYSSNAAVVQASVCASCCLETTVYLEKTVNFIAARRSDHDFSFVIFIRFSSGLSDTLFNLDRCTK